MAKDIANGDERDIGLDHMHLLGDTVEQIAAEKAGIIKPNVPVVVGRMGPGPREVILNVAREVGAPVWLMDRDIEVVSLGETRFAVSTPSTVSVELEPSLYGQIQGHNSALAYAAMELAFPDFTTEVGKRGVAAARIPGRFQKIEALDRIWILDGAHNTDSALILAKILEESPYRPKMLLTGMIQGHAPENFYNILAPLVDDIVVTPIAFRRGLEAGELAAQIGGIHASVRGTEGLDEAMALVQLRTQPGDEILVTGSFYLVGDVIRLLQE